VLNLNFVPLKPRLRQYPKRCRSGEDEGAALNLPTREKAARFAPALAVGSPPENACPW